MKKLIYIAFLYSSIIYGQSINKTMLRLPDTGQTNSYTNTFGEDNDYNINPPFFKLNGNGTVTDTITGLMWQQTDGGEMTYENAINYCDTLTLAGFIDWRLPTAHEGFSILNHQTTNPAVDIKVFTKTNAEYWWSINKQSNDNTKVWCTNAGGGIGNHPKSETISAGGTKKFHARAVRDINLPSTLKSHFTDNGNGTITDNLTNLIWQKITYSDSLTWEQALAYSDSLTYSGFNDWRLPNIKELQSLNDESIINPSIDKTIFTNLGIKKYWSSTTLPNQTAKAWYLHTQFGITTYDNKTARNMIICVRGDGKIESQKDTSNYYEAIIPAGEYEMGDHFGFVDPAHPSDETPVHKVKVNSIYLYKTETTNLDFMNFLNDALTQKQIEIKNNIVYGISTNEIYYYTYQNSNFYSIGFDGSKFVIADFRSYHPVVGAMWNGVAAFCNWKSLKSGFQECYNLKTWTCDFSKNGYRLPTEAEWEFAGRGGNTTTYLIYPTSNTVDISKANLPNSGDPYENNNLPNTTPVGFYDGKLKLKTEYNWPNNVSTYQTSDGANGYGLYDMQGNVWEFVNDWYGQNYYASSPFDNPKGPDTGFIMPDGKPYRGMRGGNWYNGLVTNGANDGHSRVANRNPSYYRGPQDPNHPWYHIGFRVARNYTGNTSIIENGIYNSDYVNNYPNPFNNETKIGLKLDKYSNVSLKIYNSLGQLISTLVENELESGNYEYIWNSNNHEIGVYTYYLTIDNEILAKKMILIK